MATFVLFTPGFLRTWKNGGAGGGRGKLRGGGRESLAGGHDPVLRDNEQLQNRTPFGNDGNHTAGSEKFKQKMRRWPHSLSRALLFREDFERASIVALEGRRAGLYRVPRDPALPLERLLRAEIHQLCRGDDDELWVLAYRESEPRVLVATPHSPAVAILTLSDLLARTLDAAPLPSPRSLALVLEVLAAESQKRLAVGLRRALNDPRGAVRAAAALFLDRVEGGIGTAAIWLSSRDPEVEVRRAGLAAAERRCTVETEGLCRSLLKMFVDDRDASIAWQSRDLLLDRDLNAALEDASSGYKLDLISRMTGGNKEHGALDRRILFRFLRDRDSEVRNHARLVLDRMSP